jgi:hypothetical protein
MPSSSPSAAEIGHLRVMVDSVKLAGFQHTHFETAICSGIVSPENPKVLLEIARITIYTKRPLSEVLF